jgi:FkbM family methyltransferase
MIKTISDGKIVYDIFLPNYNTDFLQRQIRLLSKPYEIKMLEDMASRLNNNSVVLDIGANIGNHSLYLALSVGCKTICFEPDKNLCKAIRYSSEINNIENKIDIHNVALGLEESVCKIVMNEENPNSVGSQQVVSGFGNIPMKTLDSFNIQQVDCIKIDVEGFEEKVLLGGMQTIKNHLPILYIEAWNKEYLNKTLDIIGPLGYTSKQRFNATPTYLFTTD